jgi:hypothetical protein
MGKWATELAEHVINFVARSAIKSQVLTDFVADWTPSVPKGDLVGHTPRVIMQGRRKSRRWTPTRIPLYSY